MSYTRAGSVSAPCFIYTKSEGCLVEAPKKFKLVINLKTAKEIGLTIPPNVLARADRVIK